MEAKRDENRITSLLGALNTNGKTPVTVYANPNTHKLAISNGTTGSDFSIKNAPRDENRIPVAMAVSSSDGITPVILYVDSSHNLLINST